MGCAGHHSEGQSTVEPLPWCTTPIEAESSLGPDSHHPIISLSGIPSAVIVLRILHPILASTLCAANPLARIAEPTIEMLMGNLVSASTGQLWTEIASCAPRQRQGRILEAFSKLPETSRSRHWLCDRRPRADLAVEGARPSALAAGHRQTEKLQRRSPRGHAVRRPRHLPVQKQPSRSLARTDATTGTTDAEV